MSLFKGLDTPFFDSTTGEPLAFGFVYFGMPNQNAIANPKVPYANQALSTPLAATQELTIAGKFEQEVWLDGDYSVIITDSFGVQQAEYLIVPEAEGGGSGVVQTIVAGTNITVDNTDPSNPVVSSTAGDRRTVTALTSSSGIVTLNYALGDYFTLELSENVGGWIISNPPASGVGGTIAIRITQDDTARTVAFGAQIQFTASSPLDTVPTDIGSDTLLILTSFDGGAVWMATMDTLA